MTQTKSILALFTLSGIVICLTHFSELATQIFYLPFVSKNILIYIDQHIPKMSESYPILVTTHVLSSLLMVLISPIQLSTRVRTSYLSLHRLVGKLYVVIGATVGITAIILGVVTPFAGFLETIVTIGVAIPFLFFLYQAVLAIKLKRISDHQKWIIRMLSLAFGTVTQRAVFGGLGHLFPEAGPETLFTIAGIIGFYGTLAIGETYIRKRL